MVVVREAVAVTSIFGSRRRLPIGSSSACTDADFQYSSSDALLPEAPNSASNPAYRRHELPPAANRADLRSRAASVASRRSGSRIRQDTPSTIKW